MLTFVTIAAPALALALMTSLHLAWSRLTRWRPVAACVTDTDYPESERRWDRFVHGDLLMEVEEEHGRWTGERLRFVDADGVAHVAEHGRWNDRGSPRESARLLWYDHADPRRSSTLGPGAFLGLAAGCAVLLALLLRLAAA